MSEARFRPPTREHLMYVRALADDPCECPMWVELVKGEVDDKQFCRPCRARKCLEAVRRLAEEG